MSDKQVGLGFILSFRIAKRLSEMLIMAFDSGDVQPRETIVGDVSLFIDATDEFIATTLAKMVVLSEPHWLYNRAQIVQQNPTQFVCKQYRRFMPRWKGLYKW